ncbi:MAG: hypothetical protein H5U37_07095, partial [Caldisericia bacterium]|nr:hypothetical protein [Caldisericia bacterium]
KNLNKIKEFDTSLKGKIILGEIRGNKILFNYYSEDYKTSQIYILDIQSGEKINITEGLIGSFPYTPKFLDDENILFTLKESASKEYLYVYNLKLNNKKPLTQGFVFEYLYPIYIDEVNKNIYIHLLKPNETSSKISLFKFLTEEFIENYVSFIENFYFQGFSNESGEILGHTLETKSSTSKIEILDLKTKEFKTIFETKEGEISNETFLNDSKNIIFKLIPNELNKKILIYLIDRNGNILKTIEPPESNDFYIRGVIKNNLYLMILEKGSSRYTLYTTDLDKISFKKLTRENYFYGGDLIYSTSKERLILSEIKEGGQEKEYILMKLNGDEKVNLNEKLKIRIDSIIFLDK